MTTNRIAVYCSKGHSARFILAFYRGDGASQAHRDFIAEFGGFSVSDPSVWIEEYNTSRRVLKALRSARAAGRDHPEIRDLHQLVFWGASTSPPHPQAQARAIFRMECRRCRLSLHVRSERVRALLDVAALAGLQRVELAWLVKVSQSGGHPPGASLASP